MSRTPYLIIAIKVENDIISESVTYNNRIVETITYVVANLL